MNLKGDKIVMKSEVKIIELGNTKYTFEKDKPVKIEKINKNKTIIMDDDKKMRKKRGK